MQKNFQFIAFLTYVGIALISMSLGVYVFMDFEGMFSGKFRRLQSAYIISKDEKNVLLARSQVESFLETVKNGNYAETYQYWYFPAHQTMINNLGGLGKKTVLAQIIKDTDTQINIQKIVDILKGFKQFLPYRETDCPLENRKTIRLMASREGAHDDQNQSYTRLQYLAKIDSETYCEICFYVFFVGDQPLIKRITIEGPEAQVAALLKDIKKNNPLS